MMRGFLYFLEGVKDKPSLASLRAWGLGHAFRDGDVYGSRPANRGPDGCGAGVVVSLGKVPGRGYFPEAQEWREVPRRLVAPLSVLHDDFLAGVPATDGPGTEDARPRVFIGYDRQAKPGPADLLMNPFMPGSEVQLGGAEWIVPRARRIEFDPSGAPKGSTLMVDVAPGFDGDGEIVPNQVVKRHARLFDIAMQWMTAYREGALSGRDRFSYDEAFRHAAEVLSVNYRVGVVEALEFLGLFSGQGQGDAESILNACIDADRLAALGAGLHDKKKEPAAVG